MQNCTQCKLAYTDPDDPYDVYPPYEDEEDGVCTDCAEGFERYGSRCRQICDSATQYRQCYYYCYAKGNAGSWCRSNDQCLSNSCKGNYCCSDTAVAEGCSICTSDNGACSTLKFAGESCSSDFDCYQATMCAGGVCCLDGRGEAGMQNCTQCKLADPNDDGYEYVPPDEQDGVCTDCVEGFERYGSRCRQICDSATQYRQYYYYCYAKGNAGSWCWSNDQCLSGLCGQNNYCCDCDARMADENGHYCAYCTPGNGTCAARSASAFSPSGQCLNDTYVGGSAVSSGQSSAGNNNSSAGRNNSTNATNSMNSTNSTNSTIQEQQCGTDYYHDGSDCVKCPAGTTRQPGAANKCTPSGSGNVDNDKDNDKDNIPAPAPAESNKRQAEERAKKMNAGITDPMQKKKADLLAAAAIGGDKVKKLKFAQPVQAASPDDACAQAYDKAGVRPSLGACVATQTSSSGRRLVASQYDVELLFSSAEVDDAALTEAVNSLKANGLESTTSSVDPIEELKIIPGVDVTELATFETEAKAAAEEAEAQSPPPAPSPPPPSPPPPRRRRSS